MREKITANTDPVDEAVPDPWHNKSGAIELFQAQIKPGTVFMSGSCIIASTHDGGIIKVTPDGVVWTKISCNGRHYQVTSHCRGGRVCLDLYTPKGGRTSVSLETVWYVLYQMAFGGVRSPLALWSTKRPMTIARPPVLDGWP